MPTVCHSELDAGDSGVSKSGMVFTSWRFLSIEKIVTIPINIQIIKHDYDKGTEREL